MVAFRKISVWDAIKAYTISAAKASLSNQERGSLTEGKLADLIVIEDFENKPNEFWLEAKSLLTMIDGKICWKDETKFF